MKWIIITAFVLSAVGVSFALPAPVSTWQFQPGVPYRYSYQVTILLNEDSNITSRSASVGRHVGYKISSEFLLTNIWQNAHNIKDKLLKLELMKPKLLVSSTLHNVDSEAQHWSKLENLSYPPIYIHWNDGFVKNVYLLPDTESLINIKKGIAGLFQFRLVDGETEEADVSGLCKIRYKNEGKHFKKEKFDCRNQISKSSTYNRMQSTSTSTFSELYYTVMPEGISDLLGSEEVIIKLNAWSQAAVFVKSKTKMHFISKESPDSVLQADSIATVIASISKETGRPLRKDTLEIFPKKTGCAGNCKSLRALVAEYGDFMQADTIGTMKSASGFLKILEGFRHASKKELLTVFKDSREQLLVQMVDVLAATQTEDSLDVTFQLIDFESDDIAITERFLHCLSVIPNPSEMVLRKTLKLTQKKIKNYKLHTTVLITISSLLKTYWKNNLNQSNSKLVDTAIEFILGGLKCNDPQCLLLQLYAIKNAAHPKFIPFLLRHVPAGRNIGRISIEALKEIGVEHFTPEVIDVLEKVHHEFWPFQDSFARVIAVDLLVNANPTVENIQKVVSALADRQYPEVNTLILGALLQSAEKNDVLRSSLNHVLQNVSFGNYDNLAQNGSSSIYTKILQELHDVNVTYGINLEMRKTGVLKRTGIDLKVTNKQEELHLLSLGLFVSGFGLTEEELKAMSVPEENSAGMELSVLGVHLRPYTFFTGTAELMGLVWSGVGSEFMPALQANMLLMDEDRSIILQSGLTFDFVLKAVVSVDVSGTIEISMWNKNAQAFVKNSAALLVQGFGRVDTSFVESHVDFALGGNTLLDMNVNIDFSSKPMKMCLKIDQPDFIFRHNVRKTETIPGSKHLIKTVKRRSIHFNGKSLALHRKNYDTCTEMSQPQPKSFW